MSTQPNRVGATHRRTAGTGEVSRRRLIVVACAASAGLHAALVPTHADQSEAAGALFGLSALPLLALSLLQTPRTAAKELAASTRGVDP